MLSNDSLLADIREALAKRAHTPAQTLEQGRGTRAAGPPVSDYRIDWSGPARRSVQRIPEKVATAVVEFGYATLAANAQRVGRPSR